MGTIKNTLLLFAGYVAYKAITTDDKGELKKAIKVRVEDLRPKIIDLSNALNDYANANNNLREDEIRLDIQKRIERARYAIDHIDSKKIIDQSTDVISKIQVEIGEIGEKVKNRIDKQDYLDETPIAKKDRTTAKPKPKTEE